MSNNIQVSQQFEPSTVTFSQLKKNKNGGKSVMLTRNNKKKLYLKLRTRSIFLSIQTMKMLCNSRLSLWNWMKLSLKQ